MNQALDVLDRIKRAATQEPNLPPSWSSAMAVAARIEAELRDDGGDMKRVRTLAAEGEALVAGRLVSTSDVPAGEAPCVTALGLWFGALKWFGRGVFDEAMGNMLSQAAALVR